MMPFGVARIEPTWLRTKKLVDATLAEGARLVIGGESDEATRYFSPTVLCDVTPSMSIMREEIFGPVLPVLTYDSLDEVLGVRPDYIEQQLAHAVKDANGTAYNRTAHLPERQKMMQAWADYLDSLREGGNVVPLRRKAV